MTTGNGFRVGLVTQFTAPFTFHLPQPFLLVPVMARAMLDSDL